MNRMFPGTLFFCLLAAVNAIQAAGSEPWPTFQWDIEPTTHAKPWLILHEPRGFVSRVQFSPDGKSLATVSPGAAVLWDTTTWKPSCTLQGHANCITDVALSPDGKSVVTVAHWDDTAKVWDAATGRTLRTLTWSYRNSARHVAHLEGGITVEMTTPGLHYRAMERAVFRPDGRQLATPGYPVVCLKGMGEDDHGEIRLWDLTTGKPTTTLRGHKDMVTAIAYHPDGRRLTSGSQDGTILIWNLGTGKPLLGFRAHQGAIMELAYRPDGRRLASAGPDGKVKVWDLDRLVRAGRGPSATGREWDLRREPGEVTVQGKRDTMLALAWSPDGKYLATACVYQADRNDTSGDVAIWDAASGKELVNLGSGKKGQGGLCVAFSPDGKQLVTGHRDGSVKIWELAKLLDQRKAK